MAAFALTVLMVLLILVPLGFLGVSLIEDGKKLTDEARQQIIKAPEEAPGWLIGVPVLGKDLGNYWDDFIKHRENWAWAQNSMEQRDDEDSFSESGDLSEGNIADKAGDAVVGGTADHGSLGNLLNSSMGGIGKIAIWLAKMIAGGITQIAIALIIVFFLFRDAPRLGARVRIAAERIGGEKGLELLDLAGVTVKGVVNGVIGTALVQGVIAGIGFLIVGAPGAFLLGAITFFVAVIPIGPPLIWGSVAVWLFLKGDTGWAIFMVIYGSLLISSLDNVVRPLLIGSGSKLPFALILFGLIGGAMTFGLVGLFVGPTILALAFRLIKGWTEEVNA